MWYLENKKSKSGLLCGAHACNRKHIINFFDLIGRVTMRIGSLKLFIFFKILLYEIWGVDILMPFKAKGQVQKRHFSETTKEIYLC